MTPDSFDRGSSTPNCNAASNDLPSLADLSEESMPGITASRELCGAWMEIGSYETWCAEPADHEGPCRPSLADLLREIRRLSGEAEVMSAYVEGVLSRATS